MHEVTRYECAGCGQTTATPQSSAEFGPHSWKPAGGLPWFWTAQGYIASSEADCVQKQAEWQAHQAAWEAEQHRADEAQEATRNEVVARCHHDEALRSVLAQHQYSMARHRIVQIVDEIQDQHFSRDEEHYDFEALTRSSSSEAEELFRHCFAAAGYADVDPYA